MSNMDKLNEKDLHLVCKVTYDKYKRCVKNALVNDVISDGDAGAASRKCSGLFADLNEYCGEFMREGHFLHTNTTNTNEKVVVNNTSVAKK